jgi:hypothetical protein
MKTLMTNATLEELLKRQANLQPALMPQCPWLGGTRPWRPKLVAANDGSASRLEIHWVPGDKGSPWLWLLQSRNAGKWTTEILPATKNTRVWNDAPPEVVAVSAVNRVGEVSSPAVLEARNGTQ